jgi:hypothetical protein
MIEGEEVSHSVIGYFQAAANSAILNGNLSAFGPLPPATDFLPLVAACLPSPHP